MFELQKLSDKGMTSEAVATSKEFLRNYVGTWGATIGRRLGYAVDDGFYGIAKPGFLQSLKAAIDKVTPEQVNAAIRKHLQHDNMYLVIITADAAGMKQKLLSGASTSITYAGERPAALLEEDKTISALPIKVKEADITRPADRQSLSIARGSGLGARGSGSARGSGLGGGGSRLAPRRARAPRAAAPRVTRRDMPFKSGDHVHVANLGKGIVREVRNKDQYWSK